jgi:lysozyme
MYTRYPQMLAPASPSALRGLHGLQKSMKFFNWSQHLSQLFRGSTPSDITGKEQENFATLKARIKGHEGRRFVPYRDSLGILTVGYGRNLNGPFTQHEIDIMFESDFDKARRAAETFVCYSSLSPARQGVLIEMIFQMGVYGVKKFRRFLDACLEQDWQAAHNEMLSSKWHSQTPERAETLARIFLNG